MTIIDTSANPRIAVVGCLHGDEIFGYCAILRLKSIAGLRLIVANEAARARNVRFIDEDLNRCFPGSPDGNKEQSLAAALLPELRGVQYVLDIHTTTSDIKMTPIVHLLSPNVRTIINASKSQEVVQMGKRLASRSLIGNVPNSVSLEFNQSYAETEQAFSELKDILESLLHETTKQPAYRRLFRTTKLIPLTADLPKTASNFVYCPELDLYPFLLHEKSYTSHQGFAAKRYAEIKI